MPTSMPSYRLGTAEMIAARARIGGSPEQKARKSSEARRDHPSASRGILPHQMRRPTSMNSSTRSRRTASPPPFHQSAPFSHTRRPPASRFPPPPPPKPGHPSSKAQYHQQRHRQPSPHQQQQALQEQQQWEKTRRRETMDEANEDDLLYAICVPTIIILSIYLSEGYDEYVERIARFGCGERIAHYSYTERTACLRRTKKLLISICKR
ncbi:hypothetical protein LTR85_009005 [Meristemomyces frigidus]|nr:hypothetical protein LTR85_009005 [Meristemomyces frigidus]